MVTKEIQIMSIDDDGIVQCLCHGGFDSTSNTHYFPKWVSDAGANGGVGLIVPAYSKHIWNV